MSNLSPNALIRSALFPEPVQVIAVVPLGDAVKLYGKGLQTGHLYEPVLTPEQVAALEHAPETQPFDGDAARFRLAVEALRLGLAYEYDPYFALSIARIDPLPHQLEAVYDYFLKLPRIRFLLADDPGAGKTIMAGLLIKELKARGLIKRILIVAPANLTFQWQRELLDKFHERFDVVRGAVLRATYGSNPWQECNQAITSIAWVARIEDARDSLLRSHWDLIVVDEAHKMSASDESHKTLAYQLGEALRDRTDHYLLMTATPHKGDPRNFSLFLRLLDSDVYADVKSLELALEQREAPFYLRRVKEALVTFPNPETGAVSSLFTQRNVRTIRFEIDAEEWDFYDALTRYVEEQSVQAAADDSARGRALGFTMALLQRRFASSVYAARRSLERMRDRREKVLADPEGYRQAQIRGKIPDDFDELPEDEQDAILEELEQAVASVDPATLRTEIGELNRLIVQAQALEGRVVESKLLKLKQVLQDEGVFADSTTKLLIFTEHKDTLDYLVGRLRGWGLTVTQIHGGMPVGDENTPGTRIYAEREFKTSCQVLVATEAAGEGINLQFCWLMVNYDIPWNPMRLEQRMGRIHRYGQEKDCLILNFVATNTREGRVLERLFERIAQIEHDLDPQHTGKVFNVFGDVLPANQLERMVREMYARNLTEAVILERIVAQVDTARFQRITHSALEGLARRELNLSAIMGKSEAAKERRLVPEVVQDFFIQAAPLVGVTVRPVGRRTGSLHPAPPRVYQVGRVTRTLWPVGERLEPRFGKLAREYGRIVFDKAALSGDATLDWVTPGHPLFETVRAALLDLAQPDLERGAVFYDLNRAEPARLDVFTAAIRDGQNHELHRRLFVVEMALNGALALRQPTLFLDLLPAPADALAPDGDGLPETPELEQYLIETALNAFRDEVAAAREREIATIAAHTEVSLNALIHRQNMRMASLWEDQQDGNTDPLLAANIKLTEDRLDELNLRLEQRMAALQQERQCTISDIRHHGRAWVLPHPDRDTPGLAPMVRDDEIERIAVEVATRCEEARGWEVESVEKDNRGFDLVSRPKSEESPKSEVRSPQYGTSDYGLGTTAVRFIEVKGRAGVGIVALSPNEYKTAERLGEDYWLYVVFNCATEPELHIIRNPVALGWQPVTTVEHYQVGSQAILQAAEHHNAFRGS